MLLVIIIGILLFVGLSIFLTVYVEAYERYVNNKLAALDVRTESLEEKVESLEKVDLDKEE